MMVGVIEQDTEESLCIIEEYMDHGTLKSLIEISRMGRGGVSRKYHGSSAQQKWISKIVPCIVGK